MESQQPLEQPAPLLPDRPAFLERILSVVELQSLLAVAFASRLAMASTSHRRPGCLRRSPKNQKAKRLGPVWQEQKYLPGQQSSLVSPETVTGA